MNIYLNIEIKKREFLSRFLLGLEAAFRGHKVYIGDIDPLYKKKLMKSGLYHDKSLTPSKNRLEKLKYLKKNNFIITSQDEEAGHLNDKAEEYIDTRYSDKTLKLVDRVYAWGNFDYINLINRYRQFKSKVSNSGNPRIDFWNSKFQKFFKKKKKKFILISSNFTTVFGSKSFFDQYKILNDLNYFKRGMDEKVLFRRMSIESQLIEEFIFTIKKLAKKNKNFFFVYRPHPLENKDHLKFIFKDFKNIQVSNDGTLSDMITNANVVIHNGCTGGLEAAARYVSTISYMPINKTSGHKLANKISTVCKTEKSLVNFIKKKFYKKKNSYLKNKNQVINRFQNYNSFFSYKLIVNDWEKFKYKLSPNKNNNHLIKTYCNYLKIRKKVSSNSNYNSKFGRFEYTEISNIKKRFEILCPEFKKIKFKILGDKIVYLEKH